MITNFNLLLDLYKLFKCTKISLNFSAKNSI